MSFLRNLVFFFLIISSTRTSVAQTPNQESKTPAGQNLKVMVSEHPPYMFKDNSGNWDGISIRIWRSVADELKYTYEFVELGPNAEPKSPIKGSVKLLTSVTRRNDSLYDLSHIYHTAPLGLANSPMMNMSSILKSFFSKRFWTIAGVLSILLLVVGSLMYVIERKGNEKNFGGERSIAKGIGSGFWWAGVTMTTIGYGDKAPVTFWGRAVALVWMLVAMAVTSVLTASLVSTVTSNASSSAVNLPNDLRSMELLALPNSRASKYLQEERVNFKETDNLLNALETVNQKGADAVIHSIPEIRHFLNSKQQLSLQVQQINLDPHYYAIGLADSSVSRQDVNRALLKFIKSPNWQRELDRFIPEKNVK